VYLDVESVLVRITLVVVTIFTGGAAALAYVALVFIMPMDEAIEEETMESSDDEPEIDSEEESAPAHSRGRPRRHGRRDPVSESRRRLIGGVLLVVIGVLFLLNNFDLFGGLDLSRLWPLIIIVPGLLLIVGRLRGA
jgi:hypothetical protein